MQFLSQIYTLQKPSSVWLAFSLWVLSLDEQKFLFFIKSDLSYFIIILKKDDLDLRGM